MRNFITSVALGASLLSAAHAISLHTPRHGQSPKVVQHGIQRRHVADPLDHDRRRFAKRDNTVQESLQNEETLYFMTVDVGTPSQSIKLHIDTGSSDMWVNVANSQLCEESGSPCQVGGGTYNANKSSTYQYLNSQFNISYVDGTGSNGDYVTDLVQFGNVKLNNQQFGIGYQSSSAEGVLGIGYPLNEVAVSYGYQPYPNVPASLVQAGYINSNAYSLWLDDLEANTGQILFGGVNSAKYTGELKTVPIVQDPNGFYAEFIIALTGVGSNGNEGSIASNQAISALLDAGSSLIYLPEDIAMNIYKQTGATYRASQGAAFVDCSASNDQTTIDFTFSDPTISVPMSELVVVAGEENGQDICIIGVGISGTQSAVLGDTFIRSAYLVYDLSQNEISLAQSNFNPNSNSVSEITKSNVPDATSVQGAVTSVAQISSGPGSIEGITVSGSSSSSFAQPTAAVGYNLAMLGAAGALMFTL